MTNWELLDPWMIWQWTKFIKRLRYFFLKLVSGQQNFNNEVDIQLTRVICRIAVIEIYGEDFSDQ